MARCPFAEWAPSGGAGDAYTSGPFKIVHHTTEGPTVEGALSTLRAKHVEAHFVVGAGRIVQLIDTARSARSLANAAGGVQTNRDSAVQIEVVGFAAQPKPRPVLDSVRQLCRWIEKEHGVPKVWPNGYPLPAKNGRDPGGHNRNAANWDTKGGHYGHSQVPENIHWDPGYTRAEVDYLMEVVDDVLALPRFRVSGLPVNDTLNLRSAPLGPIIGTLGEGIVVERLGTDGAWSQVRLADEREGFVATRYLRAL